MTPGQQVRFWLVVLVGFGFLIWLLSAVLMPFVAGIAIAYLLNPLADRLQRWRLPRWAAATVILIGFLLIVGLLLALLVPLLQAQALRLVDALPTYRQALEDLLAPVAERLRAAVDTADWEQLRSEAQSYASDAFAALGQVVGRLWSGGMAVFNLVSLVIIMPVVAFYLLRDWPNLLAVIDSHLPRQHAATIRALAGQVDRTLAGFLRGQALVCLALGAFYAIVLSVAGLNYALLVGLVAGILSFIPFVGTITGFAMAMGIAFVQFDQWTMWALIAGLFALGQVLEGNVLTPRLVGGAIGLHPVWIMFAILAGGALFGFTGVLLGVPVAAVIGVLARFALERYHASPFYRGPDGPDPAEQDSAQPERDAP